jgi:hypothetical protein
MGDAASIEGCPVKLSAAELGIAIVCCVSGLPGLPVGDPVCDTDNCRLDFEPIESWEMINLADRVAQLNVIAGWSSHDDESLWKRPT